MIEHCFSFIPTFVKNQVRADTAGGCVMEQMENSTRHKWTFVN